MSRGVEALFVLDGHATHSYLQQATENTARQAMGRASSPGLRELRGASRLAPRERGSKADGIASAITTMVGSL